MGTFEEGTGSLRDTGRVSTRWNVFDLKLRSRRERGRGWVEESFWNEVISVWYYGRYNLSHLDCINFATDFKETSRER